MNGGRKKRDLKATSMPQRHSRSLRLPPRREQVFNILDKGNANLVDVRYPDGFTRKVTARPGMTETAQRGWHIPGAANIPWSKAVADDDTFKPYDELLKLCGAQGVLPNRETVV